MFCAHPSAPPLSRCRRRPRLHGGQRRSCAASVLRITLSESGRFELHRALGSGFVRPRMHPRKVRSAVARLDGPDSSQNRPREPRAGGCSRRVQHEHAGRDIAARQGARRGGAGAAAPAQRDGHNAHCASHQHGCGHQAGRSDTKHTGTTHRRRTVGVGREGRALDILGA
jgi:hypothetical protein